MTDFNTYKLSSSNSVDSLLIYSRNIHRMKPKAIDKIVFPPLYSSSKSRTDKKRTLIPKTGHKRHNNHDASFSPMTSYTLKMMSRTTLNLNKTLEKLVFWVEKTLVVRKQLFCANIVALNWSGNKDRRCYAFMKINSSCVFK